MERDYFKKEKLFNNYSYRKNRIKGNQQTNILKTYNNINNEIIINIKNNEKITNDTDKKYQVRKIRLKLPDELIPKKSDIDFINLNLRNSTNSNNSNKRTIPNSVLYQKNLENKKYKLEQLINNFSIRNKLDNSNTINNTFEYSRNNKININKNNNDDNSYNYNTSMKKDENKISQIPINKIKAKYYKKPLYAKGKILYHKINNLSYRFQKEKNKDVNSNSSTNKKIILENIKKPDIYKISPIMNASHIKKMKENYVKNQIKYIKINPKEKRENLREKRLPINVNRQKKFYSSYINKMKDEENTNNSLNNSRVMNRTKNSFDRKSFRFLVNQTNRNNDLSTSFSKCYNNSTKKKPILKTNQVLSVNDSVSFTNTFNETESNNESMNNNYSEINVKRNYKFRTHKFLRNTVNLNHILITDETDNNKSNKNMLSELKTSKFSLMNRIPKKNQNYSSTNINSIKFDLISQPRNISVISLSGINLDLYYLEEKMKLVINKIRNYEKCSQECFDYLNYFFEKNFDKELLKPIKNEENVDKMINYIKLKILCFFLCYNISLSDNFKITEILLKSIFDILFNNFLLYLCFIISENENKNDNIIVVLKKIVKDNLSEVNLNNSYVDENKFIIKIESNSKSIMDYYNIIINNIYNLNKESNLNDLNFPESIDNIIEGKENIINQEQNEKIISLFFINALKSINEINIEFLKKFFYSILCINNEPKAINIINNNNNPINNPINIVNLENNIDNNPKKYFLPEIKGNKKYSLVLDLEDTLIHSQRTFNIRKKIKLCNINKKLIILRPFLFEFLEEMQSIFELILFSSNTPEYVNPIVNLIQKNKKYFEHILYRHHITLDEEGNNVKNLEFLGRDLKNIIIIDDIPRYFKLQKENGINIKPFNGDSKKDGNTLKILKDILKKIRQDVEESNDIRISLDKFRKELFPNVVDKLDMN